MSSRTWSAAPAPAASDRFDVIVGADRRSLRVLGHVAIGTGISHDVAGPDGRLYVADTRGSALFTLATRPRLHLLSRLRLPGTPYGLASDPIRRRLWVTETATNTVAELDVSRPRPQVIATFPTVRQANTVAVDTASGRVFVAGASAGVVQFFDPPQMRSLR